MDNERYKAWLHRRESPGKGSGGAAEQGGLLGDGVRAVSWRGRREEGGAMTRAMQGPCEEIEQTCLFRWAALESGAHPELALLHAIPNGGKRSKSEAARMKAAGVKPGVPDMFLPVAREGCHGLYIELKRRDGGRVSTEQTAWMEALARQGYKTALCHGWDAAREEIQRYLGGKWA